MYYILHTVVFCRWVLRRISSNAFGAPLILLKTSTYTSTTFQYPSEPSDTLPIISGGILRKVPSANDIPGACCKFYTMRYMLYATCYMRHAIRYTLCTRWYILYTVYCLLHKVYPISYPILYIYIYMYIHYTIAHYTLI